MIQPQIKPSSIREFNLNQDDLNRKMEDFVEKEMIRTQEKNKKEQHSNIGGWQSERDLHIKLGDAFPGGDLLLDLFSSFSAPMMEFIKLSNPEDKPDTSYDWNYTGAWLNVAVRGGYNAPHTHPFSQISGAYYIRTEEPPTDYPFSGRIDFYSNGLTFKNFFPKQGTLILFPGSMMHFVHPYYGSGNRICLSFNANNVHRLES